VAGHGACGQPARSGVRQKPALRKPALRKPALRKPALRKPALRKPALETVSVGAVGRGRGIHKARVRSCWDSGLRSPKYPATSVNVGSQIVSALVAVP
jgi:hypothetical protein